MEAIVQSAPMAVHNSVSSVYIVVICIMIIRIVTRCKYEMI